MQLLKLGTTLKIKRTQAGLSSSDAAKILGRTASYYSRLENGKERPSLELLSKIAREYNLPIEDLRLLEDLAGYSTSAESDSQNTLVQAQQVQVKIDAAKVPILFSDSVFISVSANETVFDFAQKLATTSEQQVVARVGVSIGHAEQIHKLLGEQLEKVRTLRGVDS